MNGLVSGPPKSAPGDAASVLAYVLAAVALLVSSVAVAIAWRPAGATSEGGAAAAVDLTLSDLRIDPDGVEVAEGGMLRVRNAGAIEYDLLVEGQDLHTPHLAPGDSTELSLAGLPPGTYTVFCSIPGHRNAGMAGSVTVTAGSGGGATGADHGTGGEGGIARAHGRADGRPH